MLQFRPLQLADLPQLRPYFSKCDSRLCDTTPGAAFMWRELYRTEWAVHGDSLYFKVDYPGHGETFTLPLGGDRGGQMKQIARYCDRRGIPARLYPVPKGELERVMAHFPNSEAAESRDTFDYLYRGEDLMYFRGKKLSGQRNHVNRFQKTYGNWGFRPLKEEDVPAVLDFLGQYAAGRDKAAQTYQEDLEKTREVLTHLDLYQMVGGILTVEGAIVGFSLGEVLGDTLFVHIEKADRTVHGAYQMLVSQFAQAYAGGEVQFINREDDTGDLGLRTSKLSYHPVELLEKYTVTAEL